MNTTTNNSNNTPILNFDFSDFGTESIEPKVIHKKFNFAMHHTIELYNGFMNRATDELKSDTHDFDLQDYIMGKGDDSLKGNHQEIYNPVVNGDLIEFDTLLNPAIESIQIWAKEYYLSFQLICQLDPENKLDVVTKTIYTFRYGELVDSFSFSKRVR
ncbi:hypothetical protein [Acinetobacter sp. P1(2025)]|uniref:hypothetical protein n=1 Tax=Acinetobacter sp. P1(2025) TaxID=3446120 RepID=UPI003F53E357